MDKNDAFQVLKEAQKNIAAQKLGQQSSVENKREAVDSELTEEAKKVQRAAQTQAIQGKQDRL